MPHLQSCSSGGCTQNLCKIDMTSSFMYFQAANGFCRANIKHCSCWFCDYLWHKIMKSGSMGTDLCCIWCGFSSRVSGYGRAARDRQSAEDLGWEKGNFYFMKNFEVGGCLGLLNGGDIVGFNNTLWDLTHHGQVMHICVSELSHHWFR